MNDMLNKGYSGTPTVVQKAIEQIGYDAVAKSLGVHHLGFCDVHGAYVIPVQTSEDHIHTANDGCPLCPTNPANGTSATEVSHYIDMDPSHNLGTNPQQKITHISQDSQGDTTITPPTVPTTDFHREIVVPKGKEKY